MSRFDAKKEKFRNENCPCNGCKPPTRYGGCHSDCKKYKVYEKEYAKVVRETAEDKNKAITAHTKRYETFLKEEYIKRTRQ